MKPFVQHSGYPLSALRRSTRIIALLDAAELAGIQPLPIMQLHLMAYLSNVLAAVWDMPALEGKVLKRRGSPFYPVLQRDVDSLVGMGILRITDLSHSLDEEGRWRLDGAYYLNRNFANRILDAMSKFREEKELRVFLQELVYAVSSLSRAEASLASRQDATYSDSLIDVGSVIDFEEWQSLNYSANAASYLGKILPSGAQTSSGEKLHMYMRHIHKRIQSGR